MARFRSYGRRPHPGGYRAGVGKDTTLSYLHEIHLNGDIDRSVFSAAAGDVRTHIRCSEVPVAVPGGRRGAIPELKDDHISCDGVDLNRSCSPEDPGYHGPHQSCSLDCSSWRDGSGQCFKVDVRPGPGAETGTIGGHLGPDGVPFTYADFGIFVDGSIRLFVRTGPHAFPSVNGSAGELV